MRRCVLYEVAAVVVAVAVPVSVRSRREIKGDKR